MRYMYFILFVAEEEGTNLRRNRKKCFLKSHKNSKFYKKSKNQYKSIITFSHLRKGGG